MAAKKKPARRKITRVTSAQRRLAARRLTAREGQVQRGMVGDLARVAGRDAFTARERAGRSSQG
jgi:hypothetical protein